MKKDVLFQFRTTKQWLRELDNWRREQEDIPSRAEAIRRLVTAEIVQQDQQVSG